MTVGMGRAATPARMRSRPTCRRATTTPFGARTSPFLLSTFVLKPSMGSVTTAGRSQAPSLPKEWWSAGRTGAPYCAHDLEDAADVGIIDIDDLPAVVTEAAGRSRSSQLHTFITALVDCITETGEIGMRQPFAGALAALRDFNYERIYTRPGSIAQGEAVVAVLRDLVEYFAANPAGMPASMDLTPAGRGEGPASIGGARAGRGEGRLVGVRGRLAAMRAGPPRRTGPSGEPSRM